MDNAGEITVGQKFLVALFSDANFLAISVLENLLSKNCYVNIFSDDRQWLPKTSHLIGNNRFAILPKSKFREQQTFNYSIFFGGFINKELAFKNCFDFLGRGLHLRAKTLLVFPWESFNYEVNSKLPISDNMAVIYVGDLLGPRFDLKSNLYTSELINEILTEKSLTAPVGEVLYPVFVSDAARTLTKWLFSFGPYGKEIFLLGEDTSLSTFWKTNTKLVGEIKLHTDNHLPVRSLPKNFEIKRIENDLTFSLTETYRWFSTMGAAESRPVKKQKVSAAKVENKSERKVERIYKYPRFLRPSVLLLVGILAFPFILLLISSGLFYLSYRQFLGGGGMPQNYILIAKALSVIGSSESKILSYVPGVKLVYRETGFAGDVGAKFSDLTLGIASLSDSGSQLVGNLLGDRVYDPTTLAMQIKTSLGYLYQNISLLETDTQMARNKGVVIARLLSEKIDFEKLRNLASQGSTFADRLPVVLGSGQRKTYLLLFQNNMELRPTGGFIGSFGLFTFDGGRLSDMTVNDVYSADGQLNGHVEPPTAIKNYLNEANWWLRDSNWDPDFPTSAKRAEWFLDKELGQEVDGVIAIDLEPIKEVLKYTGPIFLSDYNLKITSENLYQETQTEVQNSFFPGSRKKASFLTALSQNLTKEIGKMGLKKEIGILRVMFDSLEGRHIQLFLHDSSQDVVAALGWDGAVSVPNCGDGCYQDYLGLVEANLGVNKANYFVTRSVDVGTAFRKQEIDRTLTLKLTNSANPSLGPSGRYQVYIRLLVPEDSTVDSVKVVSGQNEEVVTPEIIDQRGTRQIGLFVEILGEQTKQVNFSWSSPLGRDLTSYDILVRKQAGIDSYPFTLNVNPGEKRLLSNLGFALTREGGYSYNTQLAQDLSARFSW